MSDDRELLEKAAKAAGLKLHRYCEPWKAMAAYTMQDGYHGPHWNPLTDDGDEARLEAALQLHVDWMPALQVVRVGTAATYADEPYGKDRQAARRRAGVRAAAAIGEKA